MFTYYVHCLFAEFQRDVIHDSLRLLYEMNIEFFFQIGVDLIYTPFPLPIAVFAPHVKFINIATFIRE